MIHDGLQLGKPKKNFGNRCNTQEGFGRNLHTQSLLDGILEEKVRKFHEASSYIIRVMPSIVSVPNNDLPSLTFRNSSISDRIMRIKI